MNDFTKIPLEMRNMAAWLLWHKFPQKDGTIKKVPDEFSRNGKTWETIRLLTFAEASNSLDNRSDGIGIAFTENNEVAGIDIDGAMHPDGRYTKAMEKIFPIIKQAQADGCYIETSISGTGFHIYGTCTIKDKLLSLFGTGKLQSDNVEIYFKDSYFTVSGNHYSGNWGCIDNAIREAYKIIKKEKTSVIQKKAPETPTKPKDDITAVQQVNKPVTQNKPAENEFTDSDVLQLPAMTITSALYYMGKDQRKGGAWANELLQYGYPEGDINKSEIDIKVIGVLCYWLYRFGAVEISKVFEGSALYRPDDKSKNYVYQTVENAYNNAEKFFPAVNYKKLNQEQQEKLKRWVKMKERG